MNKAHTWLRRLQWFLMGCVSAATLSVSNGAQAAPDLLTMPAQPSVRATRSLLLDVQRVGTLLFAVGEFGQILRSTDQGKTWKAGQVPVSVTLTALDFVNEQEGYAVGHDGVVLRTQDAGLHWNRMLDGTAINAFIVKAAQARVDQLQAQVDALEAASSEQEKQSNTHSSSAQEALAQQLDDASFALDTALSDQKTGPSKPLLDVKVLKSSGWVVVAGAYGQLLRSKDHGKTWEWLGDRTTNTESLHFNSLLVTREGELWVAGERGQVFVSANQGDTWSARSVGYEGSVFSLVQSVHSQSVFALGLRGHVFEWSQVDARWNSIETGVQETLNASTALPNGGLLAVGARGIVLFSADDFKTIRVARRADRQAMGGVLSLNEKQALLVGADGLRTFDLSGFR